VKPLEAPKEPRGGGSDDIADISWNVPTVYLRYPANIPNLPGHHWANAVSMATPIAHKGSTAGARYRLATALDFMLKPELIQQRGRIFAMFKPKDKRTSRLLVRKINRRSI